MSKTFYDLFLIFFNILNLNINQKIEFLIKYIIYNIKYYKND